MPFSIQFLIAALNASSLPIVFSFSRILSTKVGEHSSRLKQEIKRLYQLHPCGPGSRPSAPRLLLAVLYAHFGVASIYAFAKLRGRAPVPCRTASTSAKRFISCL
jgi:hypothetical protein